MDETTLPPPEGEEARLQREIDERGGSEHFPGPGEDLGRNPNAYSDPNLQLAYETGHNASYRKVRNNMLKHEIEHDDLTGLLTKKALLAVAQERIEAHPGRTLRYAFYRFRQV